MENRAFPASINRRSAAASCSHRKRCRVRSFGAVELSGKSSGVDNFTSWHGHSSFVIRHTPQSEPPQAWHRQIAIGHRLNQAALAQATIFSECSAAILTYVKRSAYPGRRHAGDTSVGMQTRRYWAGCKVERELRKLRHFTMALCALPTRLRTRFPGKASSEFLISKAISVFPSTTMRRSK